MIFSPVRGGGTEFWKLLESSWALSSARAEPLGTYLILNSAMSLALTGSGKDETTLFITASPIMLIPHSLRWTRHTVSGGGL